MPSYNEQFQRPATGLVGTPALAVRVALGQDISGLAAAGGGQDGNLVALQVTSNGALRATGGHANVIKNIAGVAVTTSPASIWTPASGKRFRLLGFHVSLSVAGAVTFIDGSTEILRTPSMAPGVGQASPPLGDGVASNTVGNQLSIFVTAPGTVNGYVFGIEE